MRETMKGDGAGACPTAVGRALHHVFRRCAAPLPTRRLPMSGLDHCDAQAESLRAWAKIRPDVRHFALQRACVAEVEIRPIAQEQRPSAVRAGRFLDRLQPQRSAGRRVDDVVLRLGWPAGGGDEALQCDREEAERAEAHRTLIGNSRATLEQLRLPSIVRVAWEPAMEAREGHLGRRRKRTSRWLA